MDTLDNHTEQGNKVKIIILSHSSEMGGAERSMIDLFDYWDGKNLVQPHFIIRRPLRGMQKELKKRNWDYTALYYGNWSQRNPSKRAEDIFRNATYNTRTVFTIEQLIKKIKPDLVMTNTIVSPWAAIAAYFTGVPHLWFVREYGDIDHRHVFELGREKMLQDIDTLSGLVVTNSRTLNKHIEQYINKAKTTTLYTPFDIELLEHKSQQTVNNPFTNKDSLKLVITGRIAPSKGQAMAAEAIGILNKRGYDAELCVIGSPSDPEDAEPLKGVIDDYGIQDKVHLVGHQSNPLAILKLADAGIMASQQEAFGRVTFEYMVTGRPVVGSNSGATPELIDDSKNGFLYEPGKVKSLAEKLEKYAKNKNLLSEHGLAAQRKAKSMMTSQYNADALFTKLKKTIREHDHSATKPLNFSHRWLEYPSIAQKYVKEASAASFKHIVYIKFRQKAKAIYLRLTSIGRNIE